MGGYCDECPLRQDVQRPVDSLVMRLRAMARHEHDDLSVADEAADMIEAMQARIDALMLEHCPGEMTQEQIANWQKHQSKAELKD